MVDLLKNNRSAASGGLARRKFLKGASVATFAVAASHMPVAMTDAAEGPKRGGRLRVGMRSGSTSDSLDPGTFFSDFMTMVGFALRNALVEIDESGILTPELAESWAASSDATQWRFVLRKGIEFHNGRTLNAEDVVASINHHRGEDSKSAAKPIAEQIVEVKADGKHTVIVTLNEGNADFPYLMADYHFGIMPTGSSSDWRSGIGTGGYSLDHFEPGVRVVLKRNPNYWKEDRAYFDEVEVFSIRDQATRINALTLDQIDVADRIDVTSAQSLERNPGVRVEETPGLQHYTFPMRTDTAPFDDNNVRLALKHAIDRNVLLRTLLRGRGYVGNDHPIGKSDRFYAGELPQRAYDPDKAKFHLKKAGLTQLDVNLSVSDRPFSGAFDAAVLYREYAAPTGININVVREPADGYWSNVWMKKPWSVASWGRRPTADEMLSTVYGANALYNDTFWNNERFNELLTAARTELDERKRGEMYFEMQRLVRDEGGVVIPVFPNTVFALSNTVGHKEKIASNWDLDGYRCLERWWFV